MLSGTGGDAERGEDEGEEGEGDGRRGRAAPSMASEHAWGKTSNSRGHPSLMINPPRPLPLESSHGQGAIRTAPYLIFAILVSALTCHATARHTLGTDAILYPSAGPSFDSVHHTLPDPALRPLTLFQTTQNTLSRRTWQQSMSINTIHYIHDHRRSSTHIVSAPSSRVPNLLQIPR